MGHPYEQVSFIRLGIGKKKGGGYWTIDPPADYTAGWQFGEDRALELLQWAKRGAVRDLGSVLNMIAEAQESHRTIREGGSGRRGAVFGFWRVIGWFAASTAAKADFDGLATRLMKERAESAASLKAEGERQRQEVSNRARRAAQARWAKRAA